MIKQFLKRSFKIIILFVLTCLFLMLTDPKRIPSVFLIVPFVLFALILYQIAMEIFKYTNESHVSQETKSHVIRPRLIACLAAGFPVLLLLLKSIGQLSPKDVITVAAIIIIAYFYMGKFSSKTQAQ